MFAAGQDSAMFDMVILAFVLLISLMGLGTFRGRVGLCDALSREIPLKKL